MTLGEMQRRLIEELNRADVDAPAAERLVEILNTAKDRLVSELEMFASDIFVARQSYAVVAGDTSVTLPSDFRRIIGLTRTDLTTPVEVEILDTRERYLRVPLQQAIYIQAQSLYAPAVYLEADKVYFVTTPPTSLTLLLRYAKRVADLTVSDGTSSYASIPNEWHHQLVDMAAEHACPAKSPEHKKIVARVVAGRQMMATALSQRNDAFAYSIRRVPW